MNKSCYHQNEAEPGALEICGRDWNFARRGKETTRPAGLTITVSVLIAVRPILLPIVTFWRCDSYYMAMHNFPQSLLRLQPHELETRKARGTSV
jgi:hypothetical protein